MKSIYLDYNATTPIPPEVADAMIPFLREHFGNPSSSHPYGIATKQAIENARQQVAGLIQCSPEEIVFTSGGTESNNYAIRGSVLARRDQGNHIITSAVEHPAVLEVCQWLQSQGFRLTILPVDSNGMVNPQDLENAMTPGTLLVSIMHANNEVGTIQPIVELARIAHRYGALMHTDAAQSTGKIPVNIAELDVDLLSIAGHKLYAPKGIGALYIRSGIKLDKLMFGANHELDRRAGTENVLEIVGLGAASQIAVRDLADNQKHYQRLRDQLYDGLRAYFDETQMKLNGHPDKRLPNTLSLSFRGVEANTLLAEIGEKVSASAGAACHAESVVLSSVVEAMQIPTEWAMGTVRFSVGRETNSLEINQAVEIVRDAVQHLLPREFVTTAINPEQEDIKLTHYTHGLGCACKLRPQALEAVISKLSPSADRSVLVGTETSDDAAVYRLTDDLAIVQTVDFFTPIVDDPYWFGAISAANSISDIYAMGGSPRFALNIVGFPSNRLPLWVLDQILKGAQDKAEEAGISIIGGHTVDDTEPKFGLAVTGIVNPERILRNNTAQPGDALILTKPIGFGIITTAAKRGLATAEEIEEVIYWMAALNNRAAEAMQTVGVHACTDVTGFGLLGHLHEMTMGSHVDAEISASSVPLLASASRLAVAGIIPGGTRDNLAYAKSFVDFDSEIRENTRFLLADAQTSGGLLISVSPERKEALLRELENNEITSAKLIGYISQTGTGRIHVSK